MEAIDGEKKKTETKFFVFCLWIFFSLFFASLPFSLSAFSPLLLLL